MRVALVNPRWNFDNSIYFGCRQPHLPLELGYTKAMLERDGHAVLMLDGHLFGRDDEDLAAEIADFGAAMTVVTTAKLPVLALCPAGAARSRAFPARA